MSYAELFALIPLLVLAGTSIVVLLVLACFRNHLVTTWLSLTGLSGQHSQHRYVKMMADPGQESQLRQLPAMNPAKKRAG